MMDESRQSYQQQEELARRRVEEAAARCGRGSPTNTSSPSSSSSSSPFEYRETSSYEKMMVEGAPRSSSTEAAAAECCDDGGVQQHTTMQQSPSPIVRTITSSNNNKKKKTLPYKLSEKDIFLYKLYNVLSNEDPSTTSSTAASVEGDPQSSDAAAFAPTDNKGATDDQPPCNPSIITWLPHGQGFTILQKTLFEKYILGCIIPNVKYASFLRRLKRYKFLRISSGPEMGAYYHPNFKRGQPNLLHLINTTDEIPIDKYGVDVNMAVTLSYNGGGGMVGGAPPPVDGGMVGGATTSLTSNDDPTRTTTATAASTTVAPFSPIPEAARPPSSPRGGANNDDDDASLLSLGTITPGGSIQGLTPPPTRGSRSSGRRKKLVGVEEDAQMFDDLLLPFFDVDDDDNDGEGAVAEALAAAVPPPHPPELDVEGSAMDGITDFDSLQSPPSVPSKHIAVLTGRVGNEMTSTSSSSLSSPEKNAYVNTTSRISPPPSGDDIYAVQQQMLQQEQMLMLQQEQWQQEQLLLQQQQRQQHMPMMQPHPSIVSPISPTRHDVTASCLNNGNIGSKSVVNNAGSTTKSNNTKGVTVAKDMKSFPQMLRDISRQKRLRHMAQKKQQEQRSSPLSSYSISSCFSNTTVINVPTSSMGGGGGTNIKKMFQYRRMGSAPDSLQTSFNPTTTMRQTGTKKHQFRRRGSNDGMMSYVKKASSSKYQYDRKGSADSMIFHRKGSSNYSRKSSYRRNNSCDAISSVFNTSQDHRMDVDLPSSTRLKQQQQQVEEQPYFVSMDCNEELEELRRQQQQQQHSNEEKLRRHRNHSRKDPYEELWRQVDEGSGGCQYQSQVSTSNVPDLLRSDLDLKDYYKPVAGRDDCPPHQLQQNLQYQQACPPPNLNQHGDGHDFQKIVETLIMASDDEGDYHEEEQHTYLPHPHGMRYDGTNGNDCDDYEPLPIEKKFPRYSRRCTL